MAKIVSIGQKIENEKEWEKWVAFNEICFDMDKLDRVRVNLLEDYYLVEVTEENKQDPIRFAADNKNAALKVVDLPLSDVISKVMGEIAVLDSKRKGFIEDSRTAIDRFSSYPKGINERIEKMKQCNGSITEFADDSMELLMDIDDLRVKLVDSLVNIITTYKRW